MIRALLFRLDESGLLLGAIATAIVLVMLY